MHENGWFSIRGGSKAIYEMNKVRKENILNQQFETSAPNEVWISDVTYFKCKNTKYYICVIIDLFSRKVIAYTVSTSNSTRTTKGTLSKPIMKEIQKPVLSSILIKGQITHPTPLQVSAKH